MFKVNQIKSLCCEGANLLILIDKKDLFLDVQGR